MSEKTIPLERKTKRYRVDALVPINKSRARWAEFKSFRTAWRARAAAKYVNEWLGYSARIIDRRS